MLTDINQSTRYVPSIDVSITNFLSGVNKFTAFNLDITELSPSHYAATMIQLKVSEMYRCSGILNLTIHRVCLIALTTRAQPLSNVSLSCARRSRPQASVSHVLSEDVDIADYYSGDRIIVVVQKQRSFGAETPGGSSLGITNKVRRGDIRHAVVVRARKEQRRKDGSFIKFDDNACVLINKSGDPIGSRLTSKAMPLPWTREKYANIFRQVLWAPSYETNNGPRSSLLHLCMYNTISKI